MAIPARCRTGSANAHYVTKARDLSTYLAWPTPDSPVPGTAGHRSGCRWWLAILSDQVTGVDRSLP
jgi:hypothetical protein